MMFGKIGEEMPSFEVLKAAGAEQSYEIRSYPQMLVVETQYSDGTDMDNSGGEFGRLARYIGVFSKPANSGRATGKPEAISMTAPVLLSAPVGAPSEVRTMA